MACPKTWRHRQQPAILGAAARRKFDQDRYATARVTPCTRDRRVALHEGDHPPDIHVRLRRCGPKPNREGQRYNKTTEPGLVVRCHLLYSLARDAADDKAARAEVVQAW
jgi:hypothetical protein